MAFDALKTSSTDLKAAWTGAVEANNPERVVELARHILDRALDGRFGDDKWTFYEQAFIAALDVGNDVVANECYSRLERRFPTSARVRRLKGLRLEALGKYDEAEKVYRDILQDDEMNILVTKRLICLAKARGRTADAIASLVRFLDIVYNDEESWIELSELYAKEHMYQQAAYCMEELLLQHMHNPLYYLRHAELLYTMGSYVMALKTYCGVLELCKDQLRALYGLKLCARRLLELPPQPGAPPNSIVEKLDLLATERLLHAYSRASKPSEGKSELLGVVRHWLEGK